MEARTEHPSPHSRVRRLAAACAICAAALFLGPPRAFAQLDPLLFVQRTQPNIIIAVDVANRMQRDADNVYYDPWTYPKTNAAWEDLIGATSATTFARYRRAYPGLVHTDVSLGGDKFAAEDDPDRGRPHGRLRHVLGADPSERGARRLAERAPAQHAGGAVRPRQDAPTESTPRRHVE